MAIQVVSTSDSVEAVSEANAPLADKPVVEEKSAPTAEKPGETTEDSEPAEKLDENLDDESNSTEDDGESEEIEAKDAVEKPKKKGGFQKRIERFQKQLTQKDQELEYWKNQAIATKPANKPEVKVDEKKEVTGKPKADDFESHEAYVEALTDWKLEAKEKERDQKVKEAQVKTEFQKRAEVFQSRISEFKKTTDDFDELMEEVKTNVPYHVQEVFLTSEVGPALMYELAKNPEELERISKLNPIKAALELGKLETKFIKSDSDATTVKEKKATSAPAPVKPVGSGKSASSKKSIDDPSLTQHEYERIRAAQIKERMEARG